ncbi:Myb-like dna-binding protein, partial [Globisporangium splendens]
MNNSAIERGVWSETEHDKFLIALKMYPKGPWKTIAEQIGTRSPRQVQTHAQKYYEKVSRRVRGLRKPRKKLVRPEHRLDDVMATLCKVAECDDTASSRIGRIRNGLNAVTAIPSDVFAAIQQEQQQLAESEAEGECVDQDYLDALAHRHERRASIESLLEETDDEEEADENATLSELTDSDSDSLLDFDGTYLDYLIEVLDSSDSSESRLR